MLNVLSLQPNKTELAHIWFDLFILVARECVFNAVNWEHYTVYSDCLIEIEQHKSTWYCTLTFSFFFLSFGSKCVAICGYSLIGVPLSMICFFCFAFLFYCKFYNTVWMKTPCEGCVCFLMSN